MSIAKRETPEQRERRLARQRKSESKRRLNETPEQRERRLAHKRNYYENLTPEKRERQLAARRANKARAQARARLNETPEQRERRLAQLRLHHENIHRPEEHQDRSINVMVLCQCLSDGDDPSIPSHIAAAAFKIGNEFSWLGRGYLHPDHLTNYSCTLASYWRRYPKLRWRYYQE